MATGSGGVQYPLYLELLSPYIENKKVRYSLYAASVLATAAAAINYGNTTVGITLASAGCLAEGYQIIKLAKEVKPAMNQEEKNQKILQITARVFTLGIVGGMIMNGLNLSLLCKEGSRLLNLDFQLTPDQIPYTWLKNAPSLLSHATAVTRLGAFAIPMATYVILRGDDFFFDKNRLDLYFFCHRLVENCANIQNLLVEVLTSKDIQSYLRNAIDAVYPQLRILVRAVSDLLALLQSRRVTFKQIHDWIASFSNPNKLFPQAKSSSTGWERTKYAINYLFFYTLNISLLAARLYQHPLPNAIGFCLGLARPTSLQEKATILNTWSIAPDFIGMPLTIKCRYLFERFSSTETAVAWWNIPGALLNGFYLAEDFRFYGRRFTNSR